MLRSRKPRGSPDPTAANSLQPAFQRLDELARLQPDWDSYGGDPPTPAAVDRARDLLSAVAGSFGEAVGDRALPYVIVPLAVSGVQVEWRRPTLEIEVEIGPEGQVGYLLIEHDNGERTFAEADNVPWSRALELIGRVIAS